MGMIRRSRNDHDYANVIEDLPIDELAMVALADLVATNQWNEYNYHLSYSKDPAWRGKEKLIAEATGWLRAHALIARAPSQMVADAIIVTRLGKHLLTLEPAQARSMLRLPVDLHPDIQRRVRRQFLLGEYENAIFTAMRAVEVRVRTLSGLPDSFIGRDLMHKAFGAQGKLRDQNSDVGEADSLMMFFSGSYGILRNPSGHREVSYDDLREAIEAVTTASLLMRILDRVERRLTASANPSASMQCRYTPDAHHGTTTRRRWRVGGQRR